MTSNNCKLVRREIDEADLDQQLSSAASQHLHSCPECRGFHEERRGLRSLMSSLETVAAPPDFDFRLRARLATEKDRASRAFAIGDLSMGVPLLATAALVLLIAVAGVIVKNRVSSTNNPASTRVNTPNRTPEEETRKGIAPVSPSASNGIIAAAQKDGGHSVKSPWPKQQRASKLPKSGSQPNSVTLAQNNERRATRDAGLAPASVVIRNLLADAVRVPIDTSLKISVNDERGATRTISLPAVSFGSQRVLERWLPFAPVKSTKGVW